MWGFGRFLGIVMMAQVISGLLLTFFYVRGSEAWNSVVILTREVSGGWVLRLLHRNLASYVFLVLFIHFFRGIMQRSFYLLLPWVRGWLIKTLTIIAAFLGYVLPWGQISFWGATVIINLLRILPKGKIIVIWLWGGFYVSSYTCRFFFSIHYIVPFVVLVLAAFHLLLLHTTGRRIPGGLSRHGLMIKFGFFFRFKDLVNLRVLWIILLWCFFSPDWSSDPVNFVISDLSNSPIHIQPEWYFLHFYAILRSIPNKIGGLIGFGIALVVLLVLRAVTSHWTTSQFTMFTFISWGFLGRNILLLWLGIQPVEDPFVFIGQFITFTYFRILALILIIDILFS